VAHLDEIESGCFGAYGLADQFAGPEGFGGQLVSDLHGSSGSCSGGCARTTVARRYRARARYPSVGRGNARRARAGVPRGPARGSGQAAAGIRSGVRVTVAPAAVARWAKAIASWIAAPPGSLLK